MTIPVGPYVVYENYSWPTSGSIHEPYILIPYKCPMHAHHMRGTIWGQIYLCMGIHVLLMRTKVGLCMGPIYGSPMYGPPYMEYHLLQHLWPINGDPHTELGFQNPIHWTWCMDGAPYIWPHGCTPHMFKNRYSLKPTYVYAVTCRSLYRTACIRRTFWRSCASKLWAMQTSRGRNTFKFVYICLISAMNIVTLHACCCLGSVVKKKTQQDALKLICCILLVQFSLGK